MPDSQDYCQRSGNGGIIHGMYWCCGYHQRSYPINIAPVHLETTEPPPKIELPPLTNRVLIQPIASAGKVTSFKMSQGDGTWTRHPMRHDGIIEIAYPTVSPE